MGSYPVVFALYNSQESKLDHLPVIYHDAHSDWLQSVAELGLVGTALIGAAAALPALAARRMRVSTTDPQPRHLGMQNGFDFLVAGCRHPATGAKLKCGQYCLMSLGKRHPSLHAVTHRIVKVSKAV